MIVGVGGQGTLLTSRIIGKAAMAKGYDVKISEVHGMAQRGGSVVTFVRFGDKVCEPVVEEGQADVIIAFERLEALRYAHFLKRDGVIVVNDSNKTAKIKVTVFFTDKEPFEGIEWTVEAKRVRCFRMNNLADMCGYAVPYETQYAMKLESSEPIVVQYGRLDNRQTNLAYYTTLGY